jgi:hypothetical protein
LSNQGCDAGPYVVYIHGFSVDCNGNFVSLALLGIGETKDFTDASLAGRRM